MGMHIGLLIWIIVSAICIYSGDKISKKTKDKIFLSMSFIPIALIAALRNLGVGLDTSVYISVYHNLNMSVNSWEEQNWEKAYVLLNKIVGRLSNHNEQVYLGCVALIILIGIGYFILKNSEEISAFSPVFLFITLNHYLTSMVSLRQYSALAIGINSYTILKKDNSYKAIIKSIILIFISMLFHKSAFVLLVIPILFRLKEINRKTVFTIIIAGAFIFMFFFEVMDVLMWIFPEYAGYKTGGDVKFQGTTLGNTYKLLLLLKIFVMVLIFKLTPKLEINRELYILLVLTIISAIISTFTMRVALIWRMGYYFDIFLIILIPKMIRRIKDMQGLANLCVLLLGSAYYLYLLFVNTAGCVPYSFFWQ